MGIWRITLVGWVIFLLSCQEEKIPHVLFPENLEVDTIPFASEPNSNIILLEAIIEGKPYKLVFDSGAGRTLINSTIPSRRIASDTIFIIDILNKTHSTFPALVDTLQIGNIKVMGMDSYLQRDLNIDGILGDDIIGKLVWKFDLFNRKVYVTRDVTHFDLKVKSIPFTRRGQFIFVACKINGVKMELIVDTGYGGFLSINKKTADSVGNFGKKPVFWEGTSVRLTGNPYALPSFSPRLDSTYYLSANLEMGGILLKNEIIEITSSPFNIIGMDFFKRFDYFVLDYPHRMIRFGNQQNKSLDFLVSSFMRMNTKGIRLLPSKNKVQIGRITPSAKEAGISYGDTVISIDGISLMNRDSTFYKDKSRLHEVENQYEYNPSPFRKIWNDFHFISDTSVIELKRGERSQCLTLIREYYLRDMPDSLHDYYMDLSLPIPTVNRVKTASDNYYFRFKTQELLPWGLRNE